MPLPRGARSVARFIRSERRTLTQGFVALFISSGGDLLAGLALSFMDKQLRELPGLIVLIPAAIGMRGNIFGALGSRLGTGINAGQFEPNLSRDGFLGQNALGSWYLTLATCLFLGPAAHAVASAFTVETLSIADFVTISIIGGMLGSVVVGGASLGIALVCPTVADGTSTPFRRPWSPPSATSRRCRRCGWRRSSSSGSRERRRWSQP